MSSWTPGLPSAMYSDVATFLTESSAYPISETRSGTPFTVATMTSLNCSVAWMRPSVRRPTSHLPCSSVPPGISTFSCRMAFTTWSIDSPCAFSFSTSTTM